MNAGKLIVFCLLPCLLYLNVQGQKLKQRDAVALAETTLRQPKATDTASFIALGEPVIYQPN